MSSLALTLALLVSADGPVCDDDCRAALITGIDAAAGVGLAIGAWVDPRGDAGRGAAIGASALGAASLGALIGMGASWGISLLVKNDPIVAILGAVAGAFIGGALALAAGGVAGYFASATPGTERAVTGIAGGIAMQVPVLVFAVYSLVNRGSSAPLDAPNP
ncbi:MAG: hypothetical protein JNK82_24440 [Myxococcaceae bacterium]|nr:hypothetical protein [Myxococcaceae bacterium]